MTVKNKTCEERIDKVLKERLEDLRKLWKRYLNGVDEDPELGSIYDYGLCFDYVPPEKEEEEGYFRYQLSWGGPSDEFRFYCGPDFQPYRIEYWFLDWFDGANRVLHGRDFDLLDDIFQSLFVETGTAQAELEEALNY